MPFPEAPRPNTKPPKRSQALVAFVRGEIEQYRSGQIQTLTSRSDLAEKFGYRSPNSFNQLLMKDEFAVEGSDLEKKYLPEPSQELAWVLGVLSGGGHVGLKGGDKSLVSVVSSEPDFLQAYKSTAENLFRTNISFRTLKQKKDGKTPVFAGFFNADIAQYVGDLSTGHWAHTVVEKHKWLIDNDKYLWKFLEGLYERTGIVHQIRGIIYHSAHIDTANFLSESLVRVGIKNPVVLQKRDSREGIKGVGLFDRDDQIHLASNIHPKTGTKARDLAEVRTSLMRADSFRVYNKCEDEASAVAEWLKITDQLGRSPHAHEIADMKRKGQTRFSVTVYSKRFGEGNFTAARAALEELTVQG